MSQRTTISKPHWLDCAIITSETEAITTCEALGEYIFKQQVLDHGKLYMRAFYKLDIARRRITATVVANLLMESLSFDRLPIYIELTYDFEWLCIKSALERSVDHFAALVAAIKHHKGRADYAEIVTLHTLNNAYRFTPEAIQKNMIDCILQMNPSLLQPVLICKMHYKTALYIAENASSDYEHFIDEMLCYKHTDAAIILCKRSNLCTREVYERFMSRAILRDNIQAVVATIRVFTALGIQIPHPKDFYIAREPIASTYKRIWLAQYAKKGLSHRYDGSSDDDLEFDLF